MKKKMKKRFLSAVTTLLLTLSIGTTAFAAESTNTPVPETTQPAVTEAVVESTEPTVVETIVEVTADGNIRTAIPSLVEETIPDDAEAFDINAQTRSASGYAADYTDSNVASFYIDVTGSSALWGTVTFRAWDFPSTAEVSISLYRPDGSAALTDVDLPIGQYVTKTFYNLQIGRYRAAYVVAGVDKGWIESNINKK